MWKWDLQHLFEAFCLHVTASVLYLLGSHVYYCIYITSLVLGSYTNQGLAHLSGSHAVSSARRLCASKLCEASRFISCNLSYRLKHCLLLNSIRASSYCYVYFFDMFLAATVQWPVVIPDIIIACKIIVIKNWNKTISMNDTWDHADVTSIPDFLEHSSDVILMDICCYEDPKR